MIKVTSKHLNNIGEMIEYTQWFFNNIDDSKKFCEKCIDNLDDSFKHNKIERDTSFFITVFDFDSSEIFCTYELMY